ncbi:hypothetical protein ACWGRK_04150 [Saccharomonospora azurea]|uniref:Integral membrane protein n=1 Tax=Saccharomonospora azurea NA-128 TaxID=882081 RepID=H8G846_9PSEU|nr:hypothetical protein [Saccharomonospora azurea]EHK89191.1 hypothetical protein SZMC14600_01167 [Saccharomonospora azurea SZMC 14600]EHY89398.1 hypothetical protein SacazDRAFT_02499 [Saccharomonospora azurea NA-128]
MISGFAVAIAICALAVAVWSFVLVAVNRPPTRSLLFGLAGVEALLAVQVVISVVLLIAGERPGSMLTFLAYLVGALLVLPLGTVWALAERTRSSTAVLGVACITVPVLILRMYQVWEGASA